jgi:hypothetical protein
MANLNITSSTIFLAGKVALSYFYFYRYSLTDTSANHILENIPVKMGLPLKD